MLTVSCKSVPVAFPLFDSNPLSPSLGGAEFVGAMVVMFFFCPWWGHVRGTSFILAIFLNCISAVPREPSTD